MSAKDAGFAINKTTMVVIEKIRYEDGKVFFDVLLFANRKLLFRSKVVYGVEFITAPKMMQLKNAICRWFDRLL